MANPLDAISSHLARNIASLRAKRSLTQNGLARLSGVPRSTVTHLESGQGNPSIHNLARIAAGLQVSVEELLATPRGSCQLIKAGDVPFKRRSQGEVFVFKLLPDPIPGMEIDRMELGPGERMGGIPHVAATKEYLTCVQGEITVYVAGQKLRVETGDVLAFPGDQPHSYHNTGTRKAVGISVVALAPAGV
jgi:transcriptional regulator with XRE-family HTH domain